MSRKHKRNDDELICTEIEAPPMTREQFIAALEEFASKEHAIMLYNADGTFTINFPNGGQITTGQIGAGA